MDASDFIQLGTLIVAICVLGLNVLQTRGLRTSVETANVLARHEMYFKTYENAQRVADPDFRKLVDAYPEDWVDPEKWEAYNEQEKLQSLFFLCLYEYFDHELELYRKGIIEADDWKGTIEWIEDLLKEPVFQDLRDHHRRNYEELDAEIERIRKRAARSCLTCDLKTSNANDTSGAAS